MATKQPRGSETGAITINDGKKPGPGGAFGKAKEGVSGGMKGKSTAIFHPSVGAGSTRGK